MIRTSHFINILDGYFIIYFVNILSMYSLVIKTLNNTYNYLNTITLLEMLFAGEESGIAKLNTIVIYDDKNVCSGFRKKIVQIVTTVILSSLSTEMSAGSIYRQL
ncbi:uncharacterized protein V2V93DRAFT_376601 [Kockiozyma suomiensis]|uniref:uncharacterized protein n=1 Tax=Kockiozyma suomiensis TaxID=1337062 RepID=UPI00334397BF